MQGESMSKQQLDRWRRRGLLPRVRVERSGWGGSSVPPHPQRTLDAALLLAELSSRGRPWQVAGAFLFAERLPITHQCLRECARLPADKLRRSVQRVWEEAAAEMPSAPRTAIEELEDLAHRAVDASLRHRNTRRLLGGVRSEFENHVGGFSSPEELEDAARYALALRFIDILQAAPWTPEWDRAARYGRLDLETPPSVLPLPGDRAVCCDTITLREAGAFRDYVLVQQSPESPPLQVMALLDSVVWDVAAARMNESGDAAKPLDVEYLNELEEDIRVMAAADTDGDGEEGAAEAEED